MAGSLARPADADRQPIRDPFRPVELTVTVTQITDTL